MFALKKKNLPPGSQRVPGVKVHFEWYRNNPNFFHKWAGGAHLEGFGRGAEFLVGSLAKQLPISERSPLWGKAQLCEEVVGGKGHGPAQPGRSSQINLVSMVWPMGSWLVPHPHLRGLGGGSGRGAGHCGH